MARRVKLTRNPGAGGLPYGEWIPAHAVKFHEDGTTSLMTETQRNRGRRNVAAGWVEEETGIFHPIRASYDYSPSRAGEKARRKPKRKAKRRRNVAAGWVESETGIFHPIRASYDYSRSRAGEGPLKKRRKPKRKAKAKARRRRR